MQVFSPDWFAHHHVKLLWLLNHWLTRRWFRWVLRIRRCDIGYARPIIELLPHAYTVLIRAADATRAEVATDFRAHHKYGKRLYYAFNPVWWTLHFWDWLLADRWLPRLSFGFATLTAYPDPSSGATTCDGYVARNGVNETFATIRAGAGNLAVASDTSSARPILLATATTDQYSAIGRGIYNFLTSNAGHSSGITSAVFSVYGTSKTTGLGSPDFHLAGATPASYNAIVAADYGQCQTTSFGSIANASWNSAGYNNVTLNASGIANINISGGISRFSTQTSWDLNNSFTGTWASGLASDFTAYFADQAGTANDPKLVVTYTITGRFAYQNKLRPAIFTPCLAR